MQGQLPRHTVATGCYGEELKSTSAMDFTKKLHINLVFPDVKISDVLALAQSQKPGQARPKKAKPSQAQSLGFCWLLAQLTFFQSPSQGLRPPKPRLLGVLV